MDAFESIVKGCALLPAHDDATLSMSPSSVSSPQTVISLATTSYVPHHEHELVLPISPDGQLSIDDMPVLDAILGAARIFGEYAAAGDERLVRKSCRARSLDDLAADVAAILATMTDQSLITSHTLVCMVSLAERISLLPMSSFNSVTLKRLVATTALLAAKAHLDEQHSLAEYASASGVSEAILRATEAQVFVRLEYDVGTNALSYDAALDRIHFAYPAAELEVA